MKCPICGKEEFIKAPHFPFSVYGDAQLNTSGCACYSCANCGYTIFVNENITSYVYAQKEVIFLIEKKINEKKRELNKLKASCDDKSLLKEQLAKYKKQLQLRKELGDDNKAVRALQESITELTREIESGSNKNAQNRIKSVENEIKHLEEQLQKAKDTIKPTLLDRSKKPILDEPEDNDGEILWNKLTAVYQENDPLNNKTISITRSLSKSTNKMFKIIKKVKKEGYRPYGFGDSASIIVVLTEEEKKALSKPYIKVLTFEEFVKES